ARAGGADLRVPRVDAHRVQRAAGLLQTDRVGERRERDPADVLLGAVGERTDDRAVGVDREGLQRAGLVAVDGLDLDGRQRRVAGHAGQVHVATVDGERYA